MGSGGADAAPHWLVHLGVMAVLADPAGAVFAVIETDGGGQPDRTG